MAHLFDSLAWDLMVYLEDDAVCSSEEPEPVSNLEEPSSPDPICRSDVQPVRYPYREAVRRKRAIVEDGQPARLTVGFLGDLLALIVSPRPNFIHLVKNVDECTERYV